MSDLLELIKHQTSNTYDDYDILQTAISHANGKSTKKNAKTITTRTFKLKGMKGGFSKTTSEIKEKLSSLEELLKTEAVESDDDLKKIKSISEKANTENENINIDEYENEGKFEEAVNALKSRVTPKIETKDTTGETEPKVTPIKTPSLNEQEEKKNTRPRPFDTLDEGTILYHPSQEIKQFGDSIIFVNLPEVLNRTKQRSFVMFFTPNEEYARRYSGMWSLNKRPVYVHKFKVNAKITGIKIIDPKIIPDSIENKQLAHGMCGQTEDGVIHGIKIEQPVNETESVAEYYICNPEEHLTRLETWIQFGSTEWVKISEPEKIRVPSENSDKGKKTESKG